MINLRASMKKLIGRLVYMFRKEITIALLSLAVAGIFYAAVNVVESPTDFKGWAALAFGIVGIVFVWRLVTWIDKDERIQRERENYNRDLQLLITLRAIVREEIGKNRNERSTKPKQ